MTPTEHRAWMQYFERHPAGNAGVEVLLAQIWALLMQVFGSDKSKTPRPEDVAPWLAPPKTPKDLEAKERAEMKKLCGFALEVAADNRRIRHAKEIRNRIRAIAVSPSPPDEAPCPV